MDAFLFHPKLVHLPIALAVLMPLISGGLLLAWWRKWLPARAWVVAVALQGVLVGSGILALQSGEAEEERVERVVAEGFIEEHEQAAEAFVWASGGVLAVMLVGLALSSRRTGPVAAAAATLGTLVVLGLGYRTGQAGGDLVYRHGAAQAFAGSAAPPGYVSPTAQRQGGEDD
jgi:uncharacterized membrane protein